MASDWPAGQFEMRREHLQVVAYGMLGSLSEADDAVQAGAAHEVCGAPAVAGAFAGRARFARPALVNGAVGAVWAPRGRPFGFTLR